MAWRRRGQRVGMQWKENLGEKPLRALHGLRSVEVTGWDCMGDRTSKSDIGGLSMALEV